MTNKNVTEAEYIRTMLLMSLEFITQAIEFTSSYSEGWIYLSPRERAKIHDQVAMLAAMLLAMDATLVTMDLDA